MQPSLGQILLVDDEPQLVRALTPALGAAGYEVSVAARRPWSIWPAKAVTP